MQTRPLYDTEQPREARTTVRLADEGGPDRQAGRPPIDNGHPPEHQSQESLLMGAAVVLFAAVLYVLTLAPSVMPGDYAEFQMSAAVLGVPHPTGYPLYTLLGKLFTLLPVGDVAYRVNLSSAIYMAGATGVLYALTVKLLKLARLERLWWLAGAGAALFAVAPTVWSMALVARSYALNALLVGSVVYALLSWRESGRTAWFFAGCLLIGLSMVHHGTTYLLLPGYGLYLLLIEAERRKAGSDSNPAARRLGGGLFLLLGYSPILFLVYRFVWGSPYYWGNPTTWKDFFSLLTGGPFQNQVMGFGWSSQLDRVAFGIGQLSEQFAPVGIFIGLVGLAVLWRRRWGEAMLLTLMMVANFFFAMNYALVGYLYFIPTYLIWSALMALGGTWVLQGIGTALSRVRLRSIATTLAVATGIALVAVVAALMLQRYPALDQSHETATRDQALALLKSAPPRASFYMDWEDISVIRFYRLVYGMRPDITLHTGDPSNWPKDVYCDLSSGSAVYVGEFAGAEPATVARDFALQRAPVGWRVLKANDSARYAVPPCAACATCR